MTQQNAADTLPLPRLLPKTQRPLQHLLKTLVAIALVKGLHKTEVVLAVVSATMHLPNPSLHQRSILQVFNTTAGWIGVKMRQVVDPLKINLGTSCDKDLTLPNWAMLLPNFTPQHWPKYIHAWLANKKKPAANTLPFQVSDETVLFLDNSFMMHSVKISFLFQTDKCLFGSSENHTRHQLFLLHGALRFGEKIHSEYFAWRAPCSLRQRWVKLHTWNDTSKQVHLSRA